MKRAPRQTKSERRAARAAPESDVFSFPLHGRDVPVPYVALWTSEAPDVEVRPEPLLGGKPALFKAGGRRGEGEPLFAKMEIGRQRLCMIRGLCQVCADPIEGPRWVAMLVEARTGDTEHPVLREPPACTLCMRTSLRLCPGLRRTRPLIVEPGQTRLIYAMTLPPLGGRGPLTEDGPELEQPAESAVVGMAKLVVCSMRRRYEVGDFLART